MSMCYFQISHSTKCSEWEVCKYANRFEKLKPSVSEVPGIELIHLCMIDDHFVKIYIFQQKSSAHTIQWEKKTKSATSVRVLSSFTLKRPQLSDGGESVLMFPIRSDQNASNRELAQSTWYMTRIRCNYSGAICMPLVL